MDSHQIAAEIAYRDRFKAAADTAALDYWTPDASDLAGQSTYTPEANQRHVAEAVQRIESLERRVDALLLDVGNLQQLAKAQQGVIEDLTVSVHSLTTIAKTLMHRQGIAA